MVGIGVQIRKFGHFGHSVISSDRLLKPGVCRSQRGAGAAASAAYKLEGMDEERTTTRAGNQARGVLALRVETIARLMLKGWSRRRIGDWVERESGWNVSARTVDRLVKRASLVLAKEATRAFNLETEFALARARLESLFMAAMDTSNKPAPDLRTALLCQRELIDLMGLTAARPEPKREQEPVEFTIIGISDDGQGDSP